MHSSSHVFSSHLKMAGGGLELVLGYRLGCNMAVDLAVLHLLHLGEQMLMVRMLGALLGHLDDRHILGETRDPVEQVGMPFLGAWGN